MNNVALMILTTIIISAILILGTFLFLEEKKVRNIKKK